MMIEIADNELRALRATLAGDDVQSVKISNEQTGFAISVNGGAWVPLGMVTRVDDRERFPQINGASILTQHYREEHDDFVILGVITKLSSEEYVVATVPNMTAGEWQNGVYRATYAAALDAFQRKAGLATGLATSV